MKVVLRRHYMTEATHGILEVDGQPLCFTLELAWVGNQRSISCIPEGTYQVKKRVSAKFKDHFELLNVRDRSFILIHPGNNAKRDLKGCIAPVMTFLAEGWGNRSREAMAKVKLLFYKQLVQGSLEIEIVSTTDPIIINQLTTFNHE